MQLWRTLNAGGHMGVGGPGGVMPCPTLNKHTTRKDGKDVEEEVACPGVLRPTTFRMRPVWKCRECGHMQEA